MYDGTAHHALVTLKFTGKERDTESGLDEFGARYYGSSLGRFMTPDWAAKPTSVPYAHFGNPQSLNLYSYVQNNPTTVGDPDGHGDQTGPTYSCSGGTCQQIPEPPMSETEKQIDTGILELSSAVFTGGASLEAMEAGAALKTAIGVIATSGLGVSGTTRIIATAAGEKSENVELGTTAVTTLTTPAGMAVTIGTGGNLKAGAVASDLTSGATAVRNPAEAAKDPAGTALTVGNVVQDIKAGYNAVKSLVSTPPPPAPPTPPPPPRCTSGDQCH
jgi:RHS repeat-associated protein